MASLKEYHEKEWCNICKKKYVLRENLVISEIFEAGLGQFLARAFLHITQVLYVLVADPVSQSE